MRTTGRGAGITGIAITAMAAASALGSSVAAVGPAQAAGVSFSMTPGVSQVVAHYTVTPAMRAGAGATASSSATASDDKLPDLAPKTFTDTAGGSGTSAPAVKSDNTQSPLNVSNGSGPTPTASESFTGQQGSSVTCSYFPHGCNPPDMAIAASPSAVLQGVNTQFQAYDTSGNTMAGFPVSAQSFFHVANVTDRNGKPCDTSSGSQPFLSDPRAIWDPSDHRFWAAVLQVENAFGAGLGCPFTSIYWIAVSQTSDPAGSWNVYGFEMSLGFNEGADFTQIGLSRDALFFSANMFGTTKHAAPFYAEVFEASKAQMEQGLAGFTADGFYNIQGSGPGTASSGIGFLADTMQPVNNQDNNTGDGLFLDTNDGPDLLTGNLCSVSAPCRGVILWRMSNPVAHDSGGAAPTLTGTLLPNTKPFAFPPPSDEPTCTQCVDPSDLRISATPVMRNGVIHAGFETAVDNGTQVVPGLVTVDVTPGASPSVSSAYYAMSGDTSVSYPAMVVDQGGNVEMVFEVMSSSINPQTRYTERTSNGFSDPGRLLKAGEASYRPSLCGTAALPVCRWGDYEAASWDGAGRVWFAGEYANSHTDPNQAPWWGRNWGTWIGAIGS
jgi:hypothetical protein